MLSVLIIISYFVFTILLGIFWKNHSISATRFEGQSLSLLMCVAASAGEWLGGTATTGVSEYGFMYGISGAWYTITNALGICFLAAFFARIYRSLNTTTVPEIIGRNLGNIARCTASVFLTLVLLVVGISQMLAVGSLGQVLFGLNPQFSILLLGTGVALYTVCGGMNAVARTNILHVIVMYAGMALALIFCLIRSNGSINNELPVSYFSPITIGKSRIISWLLSSVLGACTAQAGLQPILKAKDEITAVKSSFLTALLVAPFGIITALLGMNARVIFPDLNDAKNALPLLILTMPEILSGIVLASLLAAILSTAAPIFLSCGTLITRDIYGIVSDNNENDKKTLRFSRLATFCCSSICILMALIFNGTAILDIVYFAYSLRGGLFIVVLCSLFWKKMTSSAAISAMISMAVCSLCVIYYKKVFGNYPVPFINENWAAIISSALVCVTVSLITCKKNKK